MRRETLLRAFERGAGFPKKETPPNETQFAQGRVNPMGIGGYSRYHPDSAVCGATRCLGDAAWQVALHSGPLTGAGRGRLHAGDRMDLRVYQPCSEASSGGPRAASHQPAALWGRDDRLTTPHQRIRDLSKQPGRRASATVFTDLIPQLYRPGQAVKLIRGRRGDPASISRGAKYQVRIRGGRGIIDA